MAGLSSLRDGWVKYKQKVPDMSDSNQNLETKCNSKLYVANTAIPELFSERYHFRLWVFTSTGEYIYC